MDEGGDDPAEEEEGAEPARRLSPLGCGAAGALLFGLLQVPLLALDWAADNCRRGPWGGCAETLLDAVGGTAVLALVVVPAVLFGLATAWMVRRREASGMRRPPLWAAFAALLLLGGMFGGLLTGAVVAALAG